MSEGELGTRRTVLPGTSLLEKTVTFQWAVRVSLSFGQRVGLLFFPQYEEHRTR